MVLGLHQHILLGLHRPLVYLIVPRPQAKLGSSYAGVGVMAPRHAAHGAASQAGSVVSSTCI